MRSVKGNWQLSLHRQIFPIYLHEKTSEPTGSSIPLFHLLRSSSNFVKYYLPVKFIESSSSVQLTFLIEEFSVKFSKTIQNLRNGRKKKKKTKQKSEVIKKVHYLHGNFRHDLGLCHRRFPNSKNDLPLK